jgi:hypothetical protein
LAGSDGRTNWSHAPRALGPVWSRSRGSVCRTRPIEEKKSVPESGPECGAGAVMLRRRRNPSGQCTSTRRRIANFDGPCALRLTGTTQLCSALPDDRPSRAHGVTMAVLPVPAKELA